MPSRRDYGKPRPALILQADAFDAHPSVTVLPLAQEIHPTPLFRVTVQPSRETGLRRVSQVMDDKATTVPQAKIGARMGCVDAATMQTISKAVIGFFWDCKGRELSSKILVISPTQANRRLESGPPAHIYLVRIDRQSGVKARANSADFRLKFHPSRLFMAGGIL